MHYRKNFLSKVIFKVDFKSPLSSISDENYSSFSGKVKERYSFTVSKPITRVSFRIEPTGSGLDRQVIGKIWEHRDKEGGNKILVLSPEFLVLEYQNRTYTHFAEFKEDMAFFYEKFQSTFDLDTFPRIGLRYIEGVQRLTILQEANYFFLDISMYITIIYSHGLPNEITMYQTQERLAAVLLKYTSSLGRSP